MKNICGIMLISNRKQYKTNMKGGGKCGTKEKDSGDGKALL